jgi:hypothetical protein
MLCYSLSRLYLTLALSNARKCLFGNPFVLNDVSDIEERIYVIASYERWLMEPEQAALVEKVKRELRGKVLGCWCWPLDCHGDVLKAVADETAEETEMRRVEILKKSL